MMKAALLLLKILFFFLICAVEMRSIHLCLKLPLAGLLIHCLKLILSNMDYNLNASYFKLIETADSALLHICGISMINHSGLDKKISIAQLHKSRIVMITRNINIIIIKVRYEFPSNSEEADKWKMEEVETTFMAWWPSCRSWCSYWAFHIFTNSSYCKYPSPLAS